MKRYIKSAIGNPLQEDRDTQWELAQTSDDTDLLSQLAESYDEQIVYQVLKNPNTSPELLKKFVDINPRAYNYDWHKAELAMENPNMPIEVLSDLDKYSHLWESIAVNDSTPVSVLQKLISKCPADNYIDLISIIAINPNAPMDLLDRMFNSDSIPNLCRLAKNTNLPRYMQESLSEHSDQYVRENLACNLGVDTDILQKLRNDESRSVSSYAAHTLSKRGEI